MWSPQGRTGNGAAGDRIWQHEAKPHLEVKTRQGNAGTRARGGWMRPGILQEQTPGIKQSHVAATARPRARSTHG